MDDKYFLLETDTRTPTQKNLLRFPILRSDNGTDLTKHALLSCQSQDIRINPTLNTNRARSNNRTRQVGQETGKTLGSLRFSDDEN